MGQSVLRDWLTPFRGRAFVKARARHRRKGIGLTFPNPDAEIGRRVSSRRSGAATQANSETAASVPGRVLFSS